MPATRLVQISPLGFRTASILASDNVNDAGPAKGTRRNAVLLGKRVSRGIPGNMAQEQIRDVLSSEFRLFHWTPWLFARWSVVGADYLTTVHGRTSMVVALRHQVGVRPWKLNDGPVSACFFEHQLDLTHLGSPDGRPTNT